MKKSDFNFLLPKEYIAQYPAERRDESKLMLLERASGKVSHHIVRDMPDIIESMIGKSLLVFNNSRVRKARIFGVNMANGKRQEFLLLRQDPVNANKWSVVTKTSSLKRGGGALGDGAFIGEFVFEGDTDGAPGNPEGVLIGRLSVDKCDGGGGTSGGGGAGRAGGNVGEGGNDGGNCTLTFNRYINDVYLERHGHVPLPPYIKRADTKNDDERYQTVYSKWTGSAAAPTAGLHWSNELLDQLKQRKIETAFVTLHVGLGTFLPVRTDNIEEHKMHREYYRIDKENALKIENAKRENAKIIAVGTTSARTLESACSPVPGGIKINVGESSTGIFIYGSYRFKAVDVLFTNFHTPESTLLMLCSAFCAQGAGAGKSAAGSLEEAAKAAKAADAEEAANEGRKMLLAAYKTAMENNYRFFSYGDAMLIV